MVRGLSTPSEPTAKELRIWFDVKKNGINTLPRMVVATDIRDPAPTGLAPSTLRSGGHRTLQPGEIWEDILNGFRFQWAVEWPCIGQGPCRLRLLAARKIRLCVELTSRIKTGQHVNLESRCPRRPTHHSPAAVRQSGNRCGSRADRLPPACGCSNSNGSASPTSATAGLSIDGRVIPLADPVRNRVAT